MFNPRASAEPMTKRNITVRPVITSAPARSRIPAKSQNRLLDNPEKKKGDLLRDPPASDNF